MDQLVFVCTHPKQPTITVAMLSAAPKLLCSCSGLREQYICTYAFPQPLRLPQTKSKSRLDAPCSRRQARLLEAGLTYFFCQASPRHRNTISAKPRTGGQFNVSIARTNLGSSRVQSHQSRNQVSEGHISASTRLHTKHLLEISACVSSLLTR